MRGEDKDKFDGTARSVNATNSAVSAAAGQSESGAAGKDKVRKCIHRVDDIESSKLLVEPMAKFT